MNARILLYSLLTIWLAAGWGLSLADDTTYGTGVGDVEHVGIGELLREPEQYVGKEIRVKGRITDVCPRMGCWINIAGKGGQEIRFKVKDGEIVFPMQAKGKRVKAQGVVTRHEMTREEAVGYQRHLAEERGEPFDPETVTGPMTLYQISGTGAVIAEAETR